MTLSWPPQNAELAMVRVGGEYGEGGEELGQSGGDNEHGFELHFFKICVFET